MDDRELRPHPDEALWDRAIGKQEQAIALLDAGELDHACALQRRVVASLDDALGPAHPDAAFARVNLATMVELRGELREASDLYAAGLAVLEAWIEEDPVWPLVLDARKRKAANARLLGDFEAGRALLTAAAILVHARAGETSIEAARLENDRGVHEKLAGRLDAAQAHYQRSSELLAALGHEPPAELEHNLAGLACAREDFATAEVHARRALAARTTEFESLALGADWAGLGDALTGLHRLDEAVEAYHRALAIYTRTGHGEHPEVAYALHNLADAEAERGNFDEAERGYAEAIARKLELFGPTHHEIAGSRNNLAVLLAGRGEHERARQQARLALEAAARTPLDHPIRRGCEALVASFDHQP